MRVPVTITITEGRRHDLHPAIAARGFRPPLTVIAGGSASRS